MRSTKRKSWIFLALAALVASVVALVLRQRLVAEQVITGQATQPGYRQTPFWRIYDQIAEVLDLSLIHI